MKTGSMAAGDAQPREHEVRPKLIALIVSKGTLDPTYPPLVMATTAASMGWVQLFI